MKSVMKSIVFVGLMCVGTASWGIPFTTGFTLHGSTGNGNTLCLSGGCMGSLTANTVTNEITNLDINIDTGNPALPSLSFGQPLFPGAPLGSVTFFNNMITSISVSLTSGTNNHMLSISGNEWSVGPSLFGGTVNDSPIIRGGGSHVQVPEPGVAALLTLGLVGVGFARRRRDSAKI